MQVAAGHYSLLQVTLVQFRALYTVYYTLMQFSTLWCILIYFGAVRYILMQFTAVLWILLLLELRINMWPRQGPRRARMCRARSARSMLVLYIKSKCVSVCPSVRPKPLHFTAPWCTLVQITAVWCSLVLQFDAGCCRSLQFTAGHFGAV